MSNDGSASLRDALALLEHPSFPQRTFAGTVERAASLAAGTIRGADMAGIALLEDGFIATGGASTELVEQIDSFQYASDEGPCLEALRTDRVVSMESTTFDQRWPRFARKSSAKGVGSVLSAPLRTAAGVIGSLNLYAYKTSSFDDLDRAAISRFADATAGLIADQ